MRKTTAMVKDEIRLLGVDDAPFTFDDDTTALIGAVYRGGQYLEGVLKRSVTVDGTDATATVIDMVLNGRHRDQIQYIILDGITFAGLNVVDIAAVTEQTGCGVIAVSRNEPDPERMAAAMDHVEDGEERLAVVEQTGDPHMFETAHGPIYFQYAGVSPDRAQDVLTTACMRSMIPEPVRAAHMIAGALKNGESKGRV